MVVWRLPTVAVMAITLSIVMVTSLSAQGRRSPWTGTWRVTTEWVDCRNSGRAFVIDIDDAGRVLPNSNARNLWGTVTSAGDLAISYDVTMPGQGSWTNVMTGHMADAYGTVVSRRVSGEILCSGRFNLVRIGRDLGRASSSGDGGGDGGGGGRPPRKSP